MKKAMIILTAVLLAITTLIAGIPSVGADSTYWMYKIDEQILERMDNLSDSEAIPVWIWFTDFDREEMERRIEEETGMTERDLDEIRRQISDIYMPQKRAVLKQLKDSTLSEEERAQLNEKYAELLQLHAEADNAVTRPYYDARYRIMNEMGAEHLNAILEDLGIDRDTVTFFDTTVCTVMTDLPKSMVFPAAQSDSVVQVYYNGGYSDAEPTEGDEPLNVRQKLESYIRMTYHYPPEIWSYDELYQHKTENGDTDWVLLNAEAGGVEVWTGFEIIGNRVIVMGPTGVFRFGMALYDAREDTFYDLSKMTDYEKYDGLAEAIDTYGKGRLLGDLDGDGEISIIDVTIIQRCEAKMRSYPKGDIINMYSEIDSYFKPLKYYSDFNRDGSRDITDATCIQRYLADLPYPKYR